MILRALAFLAGWFFVFIGTGFLYGVVSNPFKNEDWLFWSMMLSSHILYFYNFGYLIGSK